MTRLISQAVLLAVSVHTFFIERRLILINEILNDQRKLNATLVQVVVATQGEIMATKKKTVKKKPVKKTY